MGGGHMFWDAWMEEKIFCPASLYFVERPSWLCHSSAFLFSYPHFCLEEIPHQAPTSAWEVF